MSDLFRHAPGVRPFPGVGPAPRPGRQPGPRVPRTSATSSSCSSRSEPIGADDAAIETLRPDNRVTVPNPHLPPGTTRTYRATQNRGEGPLPRKSEPGTTSKLYEFSAAVRGDGRPARPESPRPRASIFVGRGTQVAIPSRNHPQRTDDRAVRPERTRATPRPRASKLVAGTINEDHREENELSLARSRDLWLC